MANMDFERELSSLEFLPNAAIVGRPLLKVGG